MRAMLASLSMAVLLLSPITHAQTVYKYVDKHGNLVYSDTPVTGAEAVEVQPATTIQMAPVKLPDPTPKAPVAPTGYKRVTISTPSNDAVFSNDPAPVVITGSSDPRLMPGHAYRFSINGKASEPLTEPHYTLESPERGSYTAVLEIVDRNLHSLAQSAPITFHVKHHSKLFKKPTAPGPINR